MKVIVEEEAESDILESAEFYDAQEAGLGDVYVESVLEVIYALSYRGGIHPKRYGKFVTMCFRFRHAIFYLIKDRAVVVQAVIDTRRDPDWIRRRLGV